MENSRVSRVGGLVFAAGVGIAVATGQGVASAAPSETSTDGPSATDGTVAASGADDTTAAVTEAGAPPKATHAGPVSKARARSLAKLRESQSPLSVRRDRAVTKDEPDTKPDTEVKIDDDVEPRADVTVDAAEPDTKNQVLTEVVATKKKSLIRATKPERTALSIRQVTEVAAPAPTAAAVASVVNKIVPSKIEFAKPEKVSIRQASVRPQVRAEASVSTVAEGTTVAEAPQALLAPARPSPVRTILNLFGLNGIPSSAGGPVAPLPRLPRLLELIFVAVRKEVDSRLHNQLPTASYDPATSTTDTTTGAITGKVVVADADNKTSDLTVALGTAPTKGSVVVDSVGNFTYTPDAALAHAGPVDDSFTVVVSDANGPAHLHQLGPGAQVHTTTYTVNLHVDQINVAPKVTTAVSDADTSGTRTVTVTSYDADADTVGVTTTVTGPGSLSAPVTTRVDAKTTQTVYTFTPGTAAVHQAGADQTATIAVEADDSHGGVGAAEPASVVVPFHNDAPVIGSVTVSDAATDGTRTVIVTATDPDGDLPTFGVTGVDSGLLDPPTVTQSGNALTATYVYRPNVTYAANHPGQLDGFTVTATDKYGLADTDATAGIQIPAPPPQSQPPKITSAYATDPDANGKVTISVSATDDGDALSITIPPGGGTFGLGFGVFNADPTGSSAWYQVDYTPSQAQRLAAATGGPTTEDFIVTASDDDGTDTRIVTVKILPLVDQAPTINSVFVSGLAADGTQYIKVVASDPDGDAPTIAVTGVESGQLSVPVVETSPTNVVTATYTYTANSRRTEPGDLDPFTVTATDAEGVSTTQAATLTVAGAPGADDHLPVITSVTVGDPDPADGHVVITVKVDDDGQDVPTITMLGSGGSPVGLATSVLKRDGTSTTWTAQYTPSAAVRSGAAAAHGSTVETITVTATDDDGAVSTTALVKIAPPLAVTPPIVRPPVTPGGGLGGGGGVELDPTRDNPRNPSTPVRL